jgi:hypothetical protein
MDLPRLWPAKQVAEFLACFESWVRHSAGSSRVPCRKIGGLLRFVPAEIEALARGDTAMQPGSGIVVRGLPRTSSAA